MRLIHVLLAIVVVVTMTSLCAATTIEFGSNPTGNSVDFANAVSANGGTLNTQINFEACATGPLNASCYSGLGVTLRGLGGLSTILNGAGPADGNTSAPPVSPGEGPHPSSHFVGELISPTPPPQAVNIFVVSFDRPVLAAGLFTIDLFNPFILLEGRFGDPLALDAFNGAGVRIGFVNAAPVNFQNNNLYFMGLLDTNNEIQMIAFHQFGERGDRIGLDDVWFATLATPEPATLGLLGTTIGGLALAVWRKRRL